MEGKGTGRPVESKLRARVEAQVGGDLSHARVHDDKQAQAGAAGLGARAFAYGRDIFLGPGESEKDTALMAHELTHVAQQSGGDPSPNKKVEVGSENSPAEAEADRVADATVASSTEPQRAVVEDGAADLAPGQMHRTQFLNIPLSRKCGPPRTRALGILWSAVGCPYVDKYFAKYRNKSATECERVVRAYSRSKSETAEGLIAAFVVVVRQGVTQWRETGQLPARAAVFVGDGKQGASPSGDAVHMKARLGPGNPLDAATASRMGDALGTDLSHVRVHTSATAAKMASEQGARAFAVGSDIAFAQGKYRPDTIDGDALIAHELAHVEQQRGAKPSPDTTNEQTYASGGEEHDADRVSAGVLARLYSGAKTAASRVGPALKSGFGLKRCLDNQRADEKQVEAFVKQYGFALHITPEFDGARPYIVGQSIEFSFSAATQGPMVYHWKVLDPKNRQFKNNGQSVTFLVGQPGSYLLSASVRVPRDGVEREYVVQRAFKAVRAKTLSDAQLAGTSDRSYGEFRGQQAMHVALLKPDNTPSPSSAINIQSRAANPMTVGEPAADSGVAAMTYYLKRRAGAKGAKDADTKSHTYHWYAQPMRTTQMPNSLAGKPLVNIPKMAKSKKRTQNPAKATTWAPAPRQPCRRATKTSTSSSARCAMGPIASPT